MTYIENINRAIDFAEDHLLESLTIEQIAREAGLSKWYFQRIFQAMVGDTIGGYLQRRRLSLAAARLRATDDGILDIALAHGFDSHEAFTRAFKRLYGFTPSAFRANRELRFATPIKPRITREYLNHLYQGVSMQPEIVLHPERLIVGFSSEIHPVHTGLGENQRIISELWRKVRAQKERFPPGLGTERFGVLGGPISSSDTVHFEYVAGFASVVGAAASGLQTVTIPAGEYAEFIHRGPMSGLEQTYSFIYGSWLANSGRQRGDGPEFVRLAESFDPQAADATIKIHIPLAPAK